MLLIIFTISHFRYPELRYSGTQPTIIAVVNPALVQVKMKDIYKGKRFVGSVVRVWIDDVMVPAPNVTGIRRLMVQDVKGKKAS